MQQVFRCPECGREFPTQQAVQEHVNRDHLGTMTVRSEAEGSPGGERQEQCPSCSVEFPTSESMEEHQRTEHAGAASPS